MVALTPAFATLAFFCASAIAAPWPTNSKHATHQARSLPNGVQLQSFHLESTFEVRRARRSRAPALKCAVS